MSVEKRGDKWLARVSRQVEGKQRESAKRFRLKADAERWEREQKGHVERGTFVKPSRQTVSAYLDQWLTTLHDVGGRTREDYTGITRRYLLPAFGSYRLDQLTTPMIRERLAALTVRGLAPRTVAYAHAVLRRALNGAVADGLLAANPAVGHRMLPAAARREQRVLSAAQVRTILDQTRDDAHGALWAVLLTTGLRPSEALALTWGDVDLSRAELRVRRTLRRPKNGGAWLLEDTKTDKSRRAVPLLAETVDALARQRDRQAVERLVAGERYAPDNFLFADAMGAPLRADGVHKYHWLPMLRRVGLPAVRLYDARHSCATMLLEAGVPMKAVQELLGHASMTLTADTYSHVTPAFKRQAADALTAYLSGS